MIRWIADKLNCEAVDVWIGIGIIAFNVLSVIFTKIFLPVVAILIFIEIAESLNGKD